MTLGALMESSRLVKITPAYQDHPPVPNPQPGPGPQPEPGPEQGVSAELRSRYALFVSDEGKSWSSSEGGVGGYASSNDLQQGALGTCYFLSAAGAVADADPEHLNKHIKDNGDGTYTVTFYKKVPVQESGPRPIPRPGDPIRYTYIPQTVTVSADELPVDAQGNPRYSHYGDSGSQQEIWPIVYETAYAKWRGGYNQIDGGFSDVAMEELTGKPSHLTALAASSPDDLRTRLGDGQALTFNTPSSNDDILFRNGTLVPNHTYVVKGITDDNRVILVNPHDGEEVVVPYHELERACRNRDALASNGGGRPRDYPRTPGPIFV